MRMYHVRTNVAPWRSDALARIDAYLAAIGSTPVGLSFAEYDYLDDGMHFTKRSQRAFHVALARLLRSDALPKPLLVLTDSTIDYHDENDDGQWTGWASDHLSKRLDTHDVVVDTVGGSGFVAGASELDHFYARLSTHRRAGFCGSVLFIGGWNDVAYPANAIRDAIRGCARLVARL